MPIYLYWGDDDFALNRAVMALRDRTLDANWASFNHDKIVAEQPEAIAQAFNQALTPPFGAGLRFVWLVNSTICQRCPESLLSELERTLPAIPDSSVLLLTTTNKPDGRLKSTKLLQKHAHIQEFPSISPWKTDQIQQQVRRVAQELGVKLSIEAVQLLAEAVGNDTRQLYTELEKLHLYAGSNQPIDRAAIMALVNTYTQNSLQLATLILQGNTGKALSVVADLLNRNEPAIPIAATLIGRFRTWLWVKLLTETGERDESAIARAAEIGNPKQVYFLQKDVKPVALSALQRSLTILLELEAGLKRGDAAIAILQVKVIELCQLFL